MKTTAYSPAIFRIVLNCSYTTILFTLCSGFILGKAFGIFGYDEMAMVNFSIFEKYFSIYQKTTTKVSTLTVDIIAFQSATMFQEGVKGRRDMCCT